METNLDIKDKSEVDIDHRAPSQDRSSERTQLDTADENPGKTEKDVEKGDSVEKIKTAVDWDGPNDPENPLNWSWAWKWYHVMIVGVQCFTITFGTSVFSPAIGDVAEHFGVSHTAALVPLSVYVLGLALGPLISAPISETWGRRQVYRLLFPISLLFSLGASLSHSFGALVACRLLASLLGSGSLAVGSGTTADLFHPTQRAPAAAGFVLWPFLGPAFGPCVGGFVTAYGGWRWPLYIILMLGAFATLLTIPMRETHKWIILEQRAKRLGLQGPPSPLPADFKNRMKVIVLITLLRPIRMLLTEPIVAFLSIYTAFNFAVLFGFFAAFPVVFRSLYPEVQVYHFGLNVSGLVFLGIAIGCLLATSLFVVMDRRMHLAARRRSTSTDTVVTLNPEERMRPAMIGSFFLPVSLFWFAWSARASIHWIVPTVSTVFFGLGNLLVFDSTVIYVMDVYGAKESGSAAAANGLLRYTAGAVFPLFMVQFVRAAGVGWSISTLGFVTILLCPVPWVFYRWGEKIRKRSQYIP